MELQYPDLPNNAWLFQNCTGLYLQMVVGGKGCTQAAWTDILVYAQMYVQNMA